MLGIAFDGLGYGSDGTLWGGELLVADLVGFERVGHLARSPCPGGGGHPRAVADGGGVGRAAGGLEPAIREATRLDERAPARSALIERIAPMTTSVGRLFDAVAALLGLAPAVTYEGQAAIELEALARTVAADGGARLPGRRRPVRVDAVGARPASPRRRGAGRAGPGHAGGRRGRRLPRGARPGSSAALAAELAARPGLDTVALSGGVFQNVRLTEVVAPRLRRAGHEVLMHRLVPPNDGGISIGQAAIAAQAEVGRRG